MVVNSSTGGIAALAAEGKIPVILGILTTDTVDQAMNRAGLKAGNLGCNWARTAVEMVDPKIMGLSRRGLFLSMFAIQINGN